MREILFRGKLVNGGQWTFGNLTEHFNGNCAISAKTDIIGTFGGVIPETVGQYTGLTDKNGKRIFEGDIVKHYNHNPIKEYSEDIGRVFYYSETCRFLRTSQSFPFDCPELFGACEYEIIGNIHDNPDLLKGE